MGMTSTYLTVSPAELDEILAGGSKKVFSALTKAKLDGGCCWDFGRIDDETVLTEAMETGMGLWADFNKSYAEVHWLLADKPFPTALGHVPNADDLLSLAMFAVDTVPGTEDLGYSPVRYLSPAKVKDIADAFKQTSCSDLAERHQIEVEEGDFLEAEFNALKDFYLRAAKLHNAVLQIFI